MKKIIALFIAAAFMVGFSAFTVLSEKNKTLPDPEFWFELNAGGTASNPLDYTLVGGNGQNPPACNLTSGYRCAILTEMQGEDDDHPGYPVLSGISQEKKRATP
ncbi:MAG: hypothetical protein JNJ86_15490 [Chitinophagaceae bacterium]|nr:hypothetical protein [Chitinophagaceae bacterium]